MQFVKNNFPEVPQKSQNREMISTQKFIHLRKSDQIFLFINNDTIIMIMEFNVNEHYINSQLSSQSFEPVFKNLSLTTISLHALKYSRH